MLIFACTLPGELIVSAHEVGVCILRYIYIRRTSLSVLYCDVQTIAWLIHSFLNAVTEQD